MMIMMNYMRMMMLMMMAVVQILMLVNLLSLLNSVFLNSIYDAVLYHLVNQVRGGAQDD